MFSGSRAGEADRADPTANQETREMLGIKAHTTIAIVLVAAAIGAVGAGATSAYAYKCPSTDPCGSVESLEHKCRVIASRRPTVVLAICLQ
jgi:hypothetical protein